MFFKPLEKVLRQRYDATEGARKLAEESLQRAAAKTADYEATLRAARSEIYQAQEQAYKELQDRVAAQIAEARERVGCGHPQAKGELAEEVEAAKAVLRRIAKRWRIRLRNPSCAGGRHEALRVIHALALLA